VYGDGGEVVAGLGEGQLAVAECFTLSPFARRRSHEPFREAPEAADHDCGDISQK